MATTDGLTLATTSAILGSDGVLFSIGGSVQSGLIGEGGGVGVGVEVGGGGEMSTWGNNSQPVPNRRDGTKIRQTTKYFMFILRNLIIIVAYGRNLSKQRWGAGMIPQPPIFITYVVGTSGK